MKNRNIIFGAILSALVCFAFSQNAQAAAAPETPDPGSVGGSLNTADGANALSQVTTGAANSAFGWFSLLSNTDGTFNTGLGAATLLLNTSGQGNTAVGAAALLNSTGNFNTAVGAAAGIDNDTGSNNIYIGDAGVSGESNVIAIGGIASSGTDYTDFFVGGVFDAAVDGATAVPVLVDAGGKLGTVAVPAAPGHQGARHQAMLNKSGHSKFEELQATVAQQQKEIALLTAQLKEQAAQIQKVSAQVELKNPAPQTVANK